MREFDPSKVNTEYRDNITYTSPIEGRKYTITHSDFTAELFVTIGLKYAEDKINPTRDEVLMEITKLRDENIFYGEVVVDAEGIKGNSKIRNEIFIREMPTALKAIRYADDKLFEEYPDLDKNYIYIKFKSTNPKYNKLRCFGNMGRYKI